MAINNGKQGGCTLRVASSREDFESFRKIALDFSRFLNVDLSFQNFEEEMAGLPGCYASPNGAILIASVLTDSGPQDAGAVAVRPLPQKGKPPPQLHNGDATAAEHSGINNDGVEVASVQERSQGRICEMKRLYVRPEFQGMGLGRALCEELIRISSDMGYDCMVLDTLERLESAARAYKKLGFKVIPPYYTNPHPGAVYWRKSLQN